MILSRALLEGSDLLALAAGGWSSSAGHLENLLGSRNNREGKVPVVPGKCQRAL
jgi:hypothetical protein